MRHHLGAAQNSSGWLYRGEPKMLVLTARFVGQRALNLGSTTWSLCGQLKCIMPHSRWRSMQCQSGVTLPNNWRPGIPPSLAVPKHHQ